eukprot:GHVU01028156.1.p1 GENE.GHVU01028156.1~~GHVU01028156.1.p1  ORF type:complete len:154 (+),score=34.18 GHVU01028156.1:50-511(+)
MITGNSTLVSHGEILNLLKEQLEIAKTNQNHKEAGQLRQQIWVLKDVINGVCTDLPEEEINEILQKIPGITPAEPEAKTSKAPGPDNPSFLSVPEKELKKLGKKMQQIKKLKEKQSKGEKLEKNQVDKIASEDSLKEEIAEMEDILKQFSLKR